MEDKINKLKTSIEEFFITPEEGTLENLIKVLNVDRGKGKSVSGRKQEGGNSGRSSNTREAL